MREYLFTNPKIDFFDSSPTPMICLPAPSVSWADDFLESPRFCFSRSCHNLKSHRQFFYCRHVRQRHFRCCSKSRRLLFLGTLNTWVVKWLASRAMEVWSVRVRWKTSECVAPIVASTIIQCWFRDWLGFIEVFFKVEDGFVRRKKWKLFSLKCFLEWEIGGFR